MASEIKVDTISEKTSAGGVTIDGLLIKDGGISGDVSLIGTTPTFTIGDAGAEDAALVFDGNAQDYYIALDDSADDLLIGLGSTVGTTPAIAIDENLKVNIPVTTASTSASTGSLTTGGGMGIGADLYVGDDVYLITDSAVLGFGADKDTTLTHTDGTGLTLNSTNKLCFNDASQFIQGASNAILALGATDEIDLTATAVDLNGTLDVSGNSQFSGTVTVGVDNTGKDVKFFGATASSHMLWDESADDLNLVASGLGVGTVGTKDLGAGIHIKTADSGASANAAADELVIENNGVAGLSILTSTSTAGTIAFGDSGDDNIGLISYDHSDNSLAIDCLAGEVARFMDYRLAIGRNSFVSSNSQVIHVNADIKAHGGGALLSVTADDGTVPHCLFQNGNGTVGSISTNGSATAYNTSSDYRIKENATAITDGITRIKTLKPYKFNFISDPDKTVDGFFAHEVSSIVPEAITGEKDAMIPEVLYTDTVLYTADDELPEGRSIGDVKTDADKLPEGSNFGDVKEAIKINPQSIDQSKIIPVTVACLKELITKIETLEAKVAVLEG